MYSYIYTVILDNKVNCSTVETFVVLCYSQVLVSTSRISQALAQDVILHSGNTQKQTFLQDTLSILLLLYGDVFWHHLPPY